MRDVERAIKAQYPANQEVTLHTIGHRAGFGVIVTDDALVFLLGSIEPRTRKRLEWPWFEATSDFLAARQWVDVGGKHISTGEAGTLDGFLKGRHRTHIANYVAAVLVDVGVADAVADPPVQIRLRRQA
jgi:hypothetical protein